MSKHNNFEDLTENLENQLKDIESGKLTNMEKDVITNRVDGASIEERNLILRKLTTQELYSELGRRLQRADQFSDEMAQLLSDYRRDDE